MTKMIFICLLMSGVVIGQPEVPVEVHAVIQRYLQDSTAPMSYGTLGTAGGYDPSVSFSDLRAGIPVKMYVLDSSSINKADENDSINSIIKSLDIWFVPILGRGKYLYFLQISKSIGFWRVGGVGPYWARNITWNKTRKIWSESSGINPILISAPYDDMFLNFPKKGARHLIPITTEDNSDSLWLLSKKSNSTLPDSKPFLRYLKARLADDRIGNRGAK